MAHYIEGIPHRAGLPARIVASNRSKSTVSCLSAGAAKPRDGGMSPASPAWPRRRAPSGPSRPARGSRSPRTCAAPDTPARCPGSAGQNSAAGGGGPAGDTGSRRCQAIILQLQREGGDCVISSKAWVQPNPVTNPTSVISSRSLADLPGYNGVHRKIDPYLQLADLGSARQPPTASHPFAVSA
jgi:hypothetical protein